MNIIPVVVLTLFCLIPQSISQASSLDIQGTLYLEDGSEIAGVCVTLTSTKGWEKTVHSNGEGPYAFTGLQPGN